MVLVRESIDDTDDKVKKLLQMAILTHKVIRFREVFAKKADK